jgi:hypothetical protein
MIPMTPMGILILPTIKPLGLFHILTISPTGSGRRATSRSPSAIPWITGGVNLKRSINGEERRFFSAEARSFRFSLISRS